MAFVEKSTMRGFRYQAWVPDHMPRLPDNTLNSCFFVFPSADEAKMGAPLGGTGFFVSVPIPSEPNKNGHVYAVTNRHVAFADSYERRLGTPAIRVNTRDGKFDVIDTDGNEWRTPDNGDDLAVRQMLFGPEHVWSCESLSLFADKEIISANEIGIGDGVFSFGRFLDEDGGGASNHPVARFGSVASLREVMIKADKDGRHQLSYLCEMRSRTGFSGSPVYVWLDPFIDFTDRPRKRSPGGGTIVIHVRPKPLGPWILGVHWGQLPAVGPEAMSARAAPTADLSFATAMTGVVPAYRLKEFLLEDPILKEQRRELEDNWKRNPTAATLESASRAVPTPEPEAEPDHREAFNRLVAKAATAKPKDDRT